MPIYEYRCTACNRITEEWVRNFDVADEQPCEHCGKPARRIMSHTSFQLKGGGWYVTDYGSHKNVPAETAPLASDAATPATGSSDTAAPAESSSSEATPAEAATPAATSAPSGSPATTTESAPKTEAKATAA